VSFAPAVTYATAGNDSYSVAIADVNGDGIPDLVVADWFSISTEDNGSVSVLLGNGDGTFQPAVGYPSVGEYTRSVATGDLRGKGFPDLVVTDGCQNYGGCVNGGVSVLLNNADGTGTFQSAVSYNSGGYFAQSVAIGDVSGDGTPDLVVANSCASPPGNWGCDVGGSVSVLFGNGNGTFQPAFSYGTGSTQTAAVALGVLRGTGPPDLVTVNLCQSLDAKGDCVGYSTLGVLLNNGDGTFQQAVTYASGGWAPLSAAIADVNQDGIPDLVVANTCEIGNCATGGVSVLLGKGDGTFFPPVTYSSGGAYNYSVAVGDVNGDGIPDLVVTNACVNDTTSSGCKHGEVSVLLGNGDGTFQTAVNYLSHGTAESVAIGDVNGDGRPDVVVANLNNVGVLLNHTHVLTTTTITSSSNPSLVNQSLTFTATVTSGSSVPNGSVITFYKGTASIGTGTTTNGVASLTTSISNAGTYAIKARYAGDVFHQHSSGAVTQVVNRYPSTTTLTSGPNPSTSGQAVTLTATVSSSAPGGATGTVKFKNGTTSLGTATLSAGTAMLTKANLPIGTLTLTAYYNGDAQSAKSSGTTTQVVSP
jgi:hypothetical protein